MFLPDFEEIVFPSGEKTVRVNSFNDKDVMILDFNSNRDLFSWFLILKTYNMYVPHWSKKVFIPFFPDARQDKSHNFGEISHSDFILNILSSEFSDIEFTIFYPHFQFVSDSLKNIKICRDPWMDKFPCNIGGFCYADNSASIHDPTFIRCWSEKSKYISMVKHRDKKTGYIKSLYVNDNSILKDLDRSSIFILDDLCDGGITFAMSACHLHNIGFEKIFLCVSHAIFEGEEGFKRLENLRKSYIEHVYTTNSFCRMESNDFITVKDIFDGSLNK